MPHRHPERRPSLLGASGWLSGLVLAVVPDPTVGDVQRSSGPGGWQLAVAWACLVIGAIAFAVLVAGSRR